MLRAALLIRSIKHFSDVEHCSSYFIVRIKLIIEVIDVANCSNFFISGGFTANISLDAVKLCID